MNLVTGFEYSRAVEPMVSFMSQLHINARRRRKFLRILAHRMFWKRFGNKGQHQYQSSFCLGTGLGFKDKKFYDPVNARRRRKILMIFAYRMSWKRFGNKGLKWVGISVSFQ